MAVIGLGKMGILHTALVNMIPQVELVAVADIDKRLSKYVQQAGLKARFYYDVEQMLQDAELDAAFICTPAYTNLALATHCLEHDLDLFVEKPLAHTLVAAKEMVKLVADKKSVHATGYLFAHIALFKKAKELLDQKIIGDIFRFRSCIYISEVFAKKKGWYYDKSKSGGGAVINIASHLIYLLYHYFGPVARVFAQTLHCYSEVEDAATAYLEFANGVKGTLDVSWSLPGYRLSYLECVVEGNNGTLELTNDYIRLYLHRPQKGFAKEWTTIHKIDLPQGTRFELGGEGYYEEDVDFIQCCLERKSPVVTWLDGLEVQKVIEAIYLSAEQRTIIAIEGMDP